MAALDEGTANPALFGEHLVALFQGDDSPEAHAGGRQLASILRAFVTTKAPKRKRTRRKE